MKPFLCLLFVVATLAGCGRGSEPAEVREWAQTHEPKRAMYHWKNTLDLSEKELAFLEHHRVERLYVRFFDVTLENLSDGRGPQPVPTATVRFKTWGRDLPEIVPTVFITPEAMRNICERHRTSEVAQKMLERIDHMRTYYGIPPENVVEIQLDCDWTTSTEPMFFDFCREVRSQMADTMLLSSTIRLHQLRRPAPPVDYGVLMLYNTSNLRNPDVENSILSYGDVEAYLKRPPDYNLPLDLAYPAYEWDLWFKDGQFRGILRSQAQADSLRKAGDQVRHEAVDYDELMRVKQLAEKRLPANGWKRSSILYHLDENNLKRYSDEEIESVFGR